MGIEIWTIEKQFEEAKKHLEIAVDIISELLPDPPPKPDVENRESIGEFLEKAKIMSEDEGPPRFLIG
ncbi:hypothetical protein F4X86_00305 [Candidatus Saccharibacteria bacterium]|nr:hypothetical protein [Candidatus Saccharibacteria bacterium]